MTGALIALLLAAAAGAGIGAGVNANSRKSYENNRNVLRELLANPDMLRQVQSQRPDLSNTFGYSNFDPDALESLGLSNYDVDQLLSNYEGTPFNLFNFDTWGKRHSFDYDRFNSDLEEYQRILGELGEAPAMVDYEGLAANANQAIDDENAQVLALYDQMLNRSNGLFESEMANNNAMFNDFANQVQTNNAMATNAIAGSTRFEMDRARRNAIRRGASAAQQLTASVNAQLGLQNRAAQQQLETSNQLASALLQQRQAAAQLRGDYVSNMNADASRRADLISGTAERKSGLRNSYYNEAESRYAAESDQWKDRIYGQLGDSPYADVYKRRQSANNTSKSTYGL